MGRFRVRFGFYFLPGSQIATNSPVRFGLGFSGLPCFGRLYRFLIKSSGDRYRKTYFKRTIRIGYPDQADDRPECGKPARGTALCARGRHKGSLLSSQGCSSRTPNDPGRRGTEPSGRQGISAECGPHRAPRTRSIWESVAGIRCVRPARCARQARHTGIAPPVGLNSGSFGLILPMGLSKCVT